MSSRCRPIHSDRLPPMSRSAAALSSTKYPFASRIMKPSKEASKTASVRVLGCDRSFSLTGEPASEESTPDAVARSQKALPFRSSMNMNRPPSRVKYLHGDLRERAFHSGENASSEINHLCVRDDRPRSNDLCH